MQCGQQDALLAAPAEAAAKPGYRSGITISPMAEADRTGVRELLAGMWQRDWSEEQTEKYFAWRYGGRDRGETLVAHDKGRCVGILDSFIRPYLIAGHRELVRETCDWFCLPQYRALGVGLHLMRRMMAMPEPILVIGGTETTVDLLPRLKWARLENVERFVLPVSTRTAAGLLSHRFGGYGAALARVIPHSFLARRIRREPPPSANVEVRRQAPGGAERLARVAPYDFAPWLDASLLDWLATAPDVLGEFVPLSFFMDGEPVGMSVSRLQMPAVGCKAQIVHLHATRLALIDWMVSETVHHLVERGAGAVLCNASCPLTVRALSGFGFVRRPPAPVYWWHASKPSPSGLLNLTSLRADDALQFA
jgi:Acetyltransferase (GNAT) domain